MHDDIEVMPSLQRPKKLCFIGNNGRKYNFLAKPEDDLRKDARLMEFNSMINKLLKGNTDTRKRNLCKSCLNHLDLALRCLSKQISERTPSCH